MLKNNKKVLVLTSVVTLLPILVGLALWNKLPEQMVIHWGMDNTADGWSGRTFAVFGLPLILLVIHWICLLVTAKDPNSKNQSRKAQWMMLWICPVLSLFVNGMVYATAFGMTLSAARLVPAFLGLMLMAMGNYLPKCKQNYTLGIKIKWTLESEENWNATHRFGGRIWVAGGFLMMLTTFLPSWTVQAILSLILLAVMMGGTAVYSYVYYRKQLKDGFEPKKQEITPFQKNAARVGAGIAVAALLFCGFLMFTGDVSVEYGADAFTVKATYWGGTTVQYDEIDSVKYVDNDTAGMRSMGFGSARLQLGSYQNDTYGSYTRYGYTGCSAAVVLDVNGRALVLTGKDAESTEAIYNELVSRTAG